MDLEHECEMGCQIFTCGSYRHHKDCKNYPDSETNRIDNIIKEKEDLERRLEMIGKLCDKEYDKFFPKEYGPMFGHGFKITKYWIYAPIEDLEKEIQCKK